MTHLQRYGPTQKFFDGLLVPEALSSPCRILAGLKREEYEIGLCYVCRPSKQYRSHDVELPPPPGRIFLVFVTCENVVLDWEWREVDPADNTYPAKWEDDFDEEVWPCN